MYGKFELDIASIIIIMYKNIKYTILCKRGNPVKLRHRKVHNIVQMRESTTFWKINILNKRQFTKSFLLLELKYFRKVCHSKSMYHIL